MSWIRSQFASLASKEAVRLNNNSQPSTSQQGLGSSVLAEPASNLKSLELFWRDASAVLCKPFPASEKPVARISATDDCETVIHFTDKMVKLLTDESSTVGCDPDMLDYFYSEEVLDKLLAFGRQRPEFRPRLISHQLGIYDTLMSHSHQLLLIQTQFTRPLMSLLDDCKDFQVKDESAEERLVSVLHQVCVAATQNLTVLGLLDESSVHDSNGDCFDLSMLLPFVHRIGPIGQQARDDLLLLMSLSSNHDEISKYITEKTDFCQVLVVSLSGLYSSLPRTLNYGSDDWHRITDEDIAGSSDLQMFLNLLEFCSALVQVSHRTIQDQLLNFVFSGFLVSVIGPTLHQVQSGMEEAITVTAYLDLFIRKIAEPRLLEVFVRFILLGKMEEVTVLEALIQRINSSNMRLCIVTLTLFKTLVDLNCEDIMYQLIFKYLLPCTHIMVSQQRSVTDIDVYGKAAEKLISMIPSACRMDNHGDGCYGVERLIATGFQSDNRSLNSIAGDSLPPSPTASPLTFQRSRNWFSFRSRHKPSVVDFAEVRGQAKDRDRVSIDEEEFFADSSPNSRAFNSDSTPRTFLHCGGTGYGDYLQSARASIEDCAVACRNWSSLYGGEGRTVLSPVSSGPTGPLSTDESYSDVVRGVGRRDPDASETNSSSVCDDVSELSGRAVVRSTDDLVPFLVRLNRVSSALDGSETSENIVAEFAELLDSLKDRVFLEGEPVSDGVGLAEDSPPPQHRSGAGVFGRGEEDGTRSAAPRDAKLSVVTHSMFDYMRGFNVGNRDAPCIGPFLTAVLNKLESMKQNTLYINLQLTGLVTRLACYPHPLLSSLLLSHTLVFQPSVKSLMQVLNTIKCRIEEFLYKVKEKDRLLDQACNFLYWRVSFRDRASNEDTNAKPTKQNGPTAQPAKQNGPMALGSQRPHPGETKMSSMMSILKFKNRGAHYNKNLDRQTMVDVRETKEMVETKNAIYCAIVFREFLKELAAISQEHALLMLREVS